MTDVVVSVIDEQDHPVPTEELTALARHVLEQQDVRGMRLSVLFVDEARIADLNEDELGGSGPTDVLAFPIDEPGSSPPGAPAILGDVVVCPSVAARQAPELGRSPEDELRLLTVHGILHLLGMDHAEPDDERAMFARTDELLASFARARGGVA